MAAWQRAAEQGVARSALVEAGGYYTKGLEVLGTLPDTPVRAQQELLLQVALSHVLLATKSPGSPEATRAFARARQLAEQLGEAAQLLSSLFGVWASSSNRGELRVAQELADQMLLVAARSAAPASLVLAHYAQGATRFHRGDLVAAREHLERAISLYDEKEYRDSPYDWGVCALSYVAHAAWLLGLADEARRRMREALAQAERGRKVFDLAWAQMFAGILHMHLREPEPALAHANAAVQLSTEHQLPMFLVMGRAVRGWTLAEQGRCEEGIAELREGLSIFTAIGQRITLELYLELLSEAYAKNGMIAEALATVEDALGAVPDEEVNRPEGLRLRAELLALRGADVSEAEAGYRDAIALARRLGARMYELRASTSLGRLLQSQGRAAEAREALAPLYTSFTEGFDTRDLVEAKALLEELG